jgi:hypothetical protein
MGIWAASQRLIFRSDRRKQPRIPSRQPAVVLVYRGVKPLLGSVTVLDCSPRGFRISHQLDRLVPGEQVMLLLPMLDICATVVWSSGPGGEQEAGLRTGRYNPCYPVS